MPSGKKITAFDWFIILINKDVGMHASSLFSDRDVSVRGKRTLHDDPKKEDAWEEKDCHPSAR